MARPRQARRPRKRTEPGWSRGRVGAGAESGGKTVRRWTVFGPETVWFWTIIISRGRVLVITGDEFGIESIAGHELEFVPLEEWLLLGEP